MNFLRMEEIIRENPSLYVIYVSLFCCKKNNRKRNISLGRYHFLCDRLTTFWFEQDLDFFFEGA